MSDINRIHMLNSIAKGVRFDGRSLLDLRKPFEVKIGVSETAEGSAKVTLGNTVVMAGVKLEMAKPFPDTPDEGVLMVNSELISLSSSEYEPGPPTIKSIEVSRIIDRALREGKVLDIKKLCITENEKVWNVNIDIIPLNDDGNLIDAGALAALIALKSARIPTVLENGNIDYQKKTDESLPLLNVPVPVTVHKIGNHFIVDPTVEEEENADARLTVAIKDNGEICALQKGGEDALSAEELTQMIDIALEKSQEYRNIYNQYVE